MTPQITNTYIIIKKGFQTNYGITLHRYRSLSFHHDKEPLDLSSSILSAQYGTAVLPMRTNTTNTVQLSN